MSLGILGAQAQPSPVSSDPPFVGEPAASNSSAVEEGGASGSLKPRDGEAEVSVADAQAALQRMEDDAGLDAAVKDALRPKYQRAITLLEEAAKHRARAATFADAIESGPEEVENLRAELAALPTVDAASNIQRDVSADDVRQEIEKERAALLSKENELQRTIQEKGDVANRPPEVSQRLPTAREELKAAESDLAQAPSGEDLSPGQESERLLALGKREALSGEVASLQQEQLSQGAREQVLEGRENLLRRQVENGKALVDSLEALASSMRQEAADSFTVRINELIEKDGDVDPVLVEEVQALDEQLDRVLEEMAEVGEEIDEISAKSRALNDDYERVREHESLGGLDGAFSQVLIEHERRLDNPRLVARSLEQQSDRLRKLRLAGLTIRNEQRAQNDLENREDLTPEEEPWVALRGELLDRLQTHYTTLTRDFALLNASERAYHKELVAFRGYLTERLIWTQSSAPVRRDTFRDLRLAIPWLFQGDRVSEFATGVKRTLYRLPIFTFLVVIVAIGLFAARRRLLNIIAKEGQLTRRIATDAYVHTLKTLVATALLAIPVPLVIGWFGFVMARDPDASDWLRGISQGLGMAAILISVAWFVGAVCRPAGLAAVHFGWDSQATLRLRKGIHWIMAGYLPGLLIIYSTLYEESVTHFDSLGRFAFMAAHAWVAFVLWRLLRRRGGILESALRQQGSSWRIAFYQFACLLVLATPVVLIALAWAGYVFSALVLSLVFLGTLAIIAAGAMVYDLVLRWFIVRERRLALHEALEKRRAMQRERREAERRGAAEAADGDGVSAAHPPEGDEVELREEELDLASVGDQTRRLLRSLNIVLIILVIWGMWTTALPLDKTLSAWTFLGKVTWLNLIQIGLIVAVATTLVRNLQGLLELAGLRALGYDAGTRHAIATICQYIVMGLAAAAAFQLLGIDWSKFGWILAALSVGLGIGLQEVVANFVSGIILLFERPIRVGDIVTVDSIDGTVTRIQIRATTITNWDRKEYIVPNKQFVTGTVMNWTLTNTVNRIVIIVGVAYGSDTEKARQILLNICHEHPKITEDPAPIATFEGFDDSSLRLILRCYQADMSDRIHTISQLHTTIHERFAEAGLEIPFPQRDLHLRSGGMGAPDSGS